jgi:hypothetical protein
MTLTQPQRTGKAHLLRLGGVVGLLLILGSTASAAVAVWLVSATATVTSTVDTITEKIALILQSETDSYTLEAASGSSTTIKLAISNTSSSVAWSAMQLGYSYAEPAPDLELTISAAECDFTSEAVAIPASAMTSLPISLGLSPKSSRDVCVTISHSEENPHDERTFILNLSMAGLAGNWETGTVSVPVTLTVKASAEEPP